MNIDNIKPSTPKIVSKRLAVNPNNCRASYEFKNDPRFDHRPIALKVRALLHKHEIRAPEAAKITGIPVRRVAAWIAPKTGYDCPKYFLELLREKYNEQN